MNQMIVTAADQHRFADATLYTVTYVGQSDMDRNVPWSYVRRAVRSGTTKPQVICKNRDGSAAGMMTVE